MKLGPLAIADALGAILVHTTRTPARMLVKGRVLDAADLDALAAAGLREITCARLEPGELAEDAAAARLAIALAGAGVRVDAARTGRANLRAATDGLLVIDPAAITGVNAIDEAITVATLPCDHAVRAGEMIATIKIIPFAVRAAALEAACAAASPIAVAPWQPRRAGLVMTAFPSTAPAILDRAAAAQRTRLARLGGELAHERRVAHDVDAVAAAITELAAAGCDPILALGASAIMDRRDVIPQALECAGGAIDRFGMPVDPGNLLLLGHLGARTFIGLPGCARSLSRSGFDWALERICAGLPIDPARIAALGVGGLLEEAPRPSPRERTDTAPRQVAAIVLAAGRSSRMGANKLLAELEGAPLVRHATLAALASSARPVVVVVGNEADLVRAAIADLDVAFVHNPDFATGMASSLRAGIAAVPEAAGALVCLGDMPRVTAAHLGVLLDAFAEADDDGAIIVPTCDRKRGNPVLWGRGRFAEIASLSGDVGARALIDRHAASVRWVAVDDPAILLDIDTPDALATLARREPA
ncbi:MAG: NTP transferase domain-containing protein [Deltaproteobacteria bacterium]|nr:NTP transferase domain-containing protein [Deltaproteobacteria bacterium]